MAYKIAKFSSTSKISVLICVILIAALASYNWALSPQISHLQASQQYRKTLVDKQEIKISLENSVESLKQKTEQLEYQVQVLESYLFKSHELKEFLISLDNASLDSGSDIIMATLLTSEIITEGDTMFESGDIIVNKISVQIKGQYGQFIEFMRRITERQQRISISNLSIHTGEDEDLICENIITIYSILN